MYVYVYVYIWEDSCYESLYLKSKVASLEEQGIIAKVETPTKGILNMLAVHKPSGAVRVCNHPCELNKVIGRNHFPLPTLDDILPTLQGAKVFSLVDAKDRFLQVQLSEENNYLMTFWTPYGRYSVECHLASVVAQMNARGNSRIP